MMKASAASGNAVLAKARALYGLGCVPTITAA